GLRALNFLSVLDDAAHAVARMFDGNVFTAAECPAALERGAVTAAGEPTHLNPAADVARGRRGQVDKDFAAIGIVEDQHLAVHLARGRRGLREFLGLDAITRSPGFLSESADRGHVHSFNGFAQRVLEHVESLVEQRRGHHVATLNASESALTLAVDWFVTPLVA